MRAVPAVTAILLVGLSPVFCRGVAEAGPRDDYTKNDWPVQAVLRPLTLAADMWELGGDTFLVNASSGAFGEPVALAPDVRRGITRRFTLGVLHDLGFCIRDAGCSTVYNDLALEGAYALFSRGNLQFAVRGGAEVQQFDRLFAGIRAGITGRLHVRRLALVFEPTLYSGVFGRSYDPPEPDEDPANPDRVGRREMIDMPVAFQLQATATGLLLFVSTGISGTLEGFGDSYRIPIGVGALYALNHKVDFGGEFRFENFAGQDGAAPSGTDLRTLLLRFALRL